MTTVDLARPTFAGGDTLSMTVFKLFGIERIHIIGCSRSGTTMLHLAMGSFAGAKLAELESGINYPRGIERLLLALRLGMRSGKQHFITKRHYSWFQPDQLAELIERTRRENVGLIHLVRDPRDVMLSRYAGSARDIKGQPYVSQDHWYDSILAADRAFDALADHKRKLVLRYEDLVLNTEESERRIGAAFGLKRDREAFSMDRVKDNFARLRIPFNQTTLQALGGLRNMDSKSVGKWRESDVVPVAETLSAHVRARFDAFCVQHGYE